MAEIHITKLVAAQRQLRAAIRLFFAQEDELAIHTVASAAYRLIADLKESRGRDEVGDSCLTMAFYVVRDYRRGTLPKNLADDPEIMKYIRKLAESLPLIKENTEYEDVRVSVSPDVARRFWKRRNKIFNFLKHADNDSGKHISMEEVDNFNLLMQAAGSYTDLGGDLGAEGYVLWLYSCVYLGKETEVLPHGIECLSNNRRLMFFSSFLTELKRERREI